MRGMSSKNKELYSEKCSKIKVTVYDMDKVSKQITKQLNELPEHKGKEFKVGDNKLALVNGQDMITDDECAYFNNIEKGVELDVYRKGEEKIDPKTGNKTQSMYMFPTCTITLTLDNLKNFIKEESNLKAFMGSRFIYNARVVGNIDNMINNFK